MIIHFDNWITLEDFERHLGSFVSFLKAEGVTQLNASYLNTDLWRGGDRLQVVGKDGALGDIRVTADQASGSCAIRVGGDIRARPKEQPFNPLAVMFNHDD
jgi:hypothetical protein